MNGERIFFTISAILPTRSSTGSVICFYGKCYFFRRQTSAPLKPPGGEHELVSCVILLRPWPQVTSVFPSLDVPNDPRVFHACPTGHGGLLHAGHDACELGAAHPGRAGKARADAGRACDRPPRHADRQPPRAPLFRAADREDHRAADGISGLPHLSVVPAAGRLGLEPCLAVRGALSPRHFFSARRRRHERRGGARSGNPAPADHEHVPRVLEHRIDGGSADRVRFRRCRDRHPLAPPHHRRRVDPRSPSQSAWRCPRWRPCRRPQEDAGCPSRFPPSA